MSRSTTAPVPGAGLVLDAVSRRAREEPAATAVVAADGTFTFAELDLHVHRIAAALARTASAGRPASVGLCLDRSRWLVPSLLAVWRVGATVVPTDARHPDERIAYTLTDAGVDIVLGRPPDGTGPRGATVLDPAALDGPTTDRPATDAADDLDRVAYVIYTSGTTGRPKGVDVTYRGLGVFLTAICGLGLPAGGVGVNAVSPAFDGWLWCTLLYLVSGQGVALVDGTAADGPALPERIAELRPATVCLTPSLMAICVDVLDGVGTVVIAGEPCPPALAESLPRDARVLNVYGPTEATIAATWADSAAGDDVREIGRPLPGHCAYVLDARRRPVLDGTTGELYLAGPALARGYRGLPGLTAARFVPDPFSARPGAYMYRTGDLVVRTSRGSLRYLGRVDDQVKIRGVRVELGEVERVAAAVPGVRAAVAYVEVGGQTLGLAVVPSAVDSSAVDPADVVLAACRRHLPAAMVPRLVRSVDGLPTTSTGKVDRQAVAAAAVAQAPDVADRPSTPTQQLVAEVWGELLGRPVDDVHADFFDLGGHSLLAARVVSALRRRTGLRLTMGHLLTAPSVAGVAEQIDVVAAGAGAVREVAR